ncbi:hypothetical protein MNBD_ACTINO01-60 [hydrothermal vent metagenome]|uniref:Nudix hydrolase domain-containing protein n=1 Tax=hydrothermal vent metagenome TaxID=652676 RepID=A0A3B0RIZ1_9ZZZZ
MHDPLTGYVRVKAICLFLHNGRVLAIDSFDPTKGQRFWVPVGGRVEFGETAREAIIREVREELRVEIIDLTQLGVVENLFTFDGEPGHEIVFVYDARFIDPQMYGAEEIQGLENGEEFTARWIDPYAPDGDRPLYPEGLPDLISREDP